MDSGITFLSFLPICGEKTFNLKKEYKMKRYLISTTLVASALSTLAAGRDYQDDYRRSDPRPHQKVRKAPAQALDTEALELAIRLEELKIQRAKQERELEREKAHTAEAQARAASARGNSSFIRLPRIREWNKEDLRLALRQAKEGDLRSQLQVGIVWEEGLLGNEPDLEKAAFWYKKVADRGGEKGREFLARVLDKMND